MIDQLRQAAQQALEALHYGKANKAVTILRKALEQPVQEPVAWWDKVNDLVTTDKHAAAIRLKNFGSSHAIALVVQDTTPPLPVQPERKPLTLNEMTAIEEKVYMKTTHKGKPSFEYAHALIRSTEAAHGIKEKT
jgi:hypothetical protein